MKSAVPEGATNLAFLLTNLGRLSAPGKQRRDPSAAALSDAGPKLGAVRYSG